MVGRSGLGELDIIVIVVEVVRFECFGDVFFYDNGVMGSVDEL